MTLRKYSSLGTVAWNEVPWSPRKKPSSWPVSCCGKKPLGTTMYRYTLSPMVAARISIISRACASAQPRLRS
ncbi:Uncharacterised protein [Bordetella pertussis]|nr:Uncharacterised protein [Bordetella pertussis]CPO51259.1 Uncharacterised protein [Bordetella pertussis]